jgi:transcriptional regulator with XRE-family HTH domain
MKEKSISDRIRKVMEQLNMTQNDLAETLGISQPAVSLYLQGRIPPADILYKIAQIGYTSIEWMLTGQDSQKGFAVQEKKPLYGDQQTLLSLWKDLPTNIQKDILTLIRHLVEKRSSQK